MNMKSLIQTNKIKTLCLISILFIISCSESENETNNSYQKQSLLSVLFVQKSPEHVASSIQAYQIAKIMLEKSLKDIGSSASIFQNNNYEDSIKISIRFLSNDIRADALNIKVFYKKCSIQQTCKITDRSETLSAELTKKILTKAAVYEKETKVKNFKPYRGKGTVK